MLPYRDLFFDLDGTLIDSYEGVSRAYLYALSKLNRPPLRPSERRRILGPPLEWSFRELSGLTGETNARAIELYREYYLARGIRECAPYPGIPELLPALREAGYRLSVATSKPESMAKQILAEKRLDTYFSFIGGAEMNGPRSDKESVLRYCLSSIEGVLPEASLMIGDRKYDILGAAPFKISGIGVLWGYGDRAELLEAGALHIVKTPASLAELLIPRS